MTLQTHRSADSDFDVMMHGLRFNICVSIGGMGPDTAYSSAKCHYPDRLVVMRRGFCVALSAKER